MLIVKAPHKEQEGQDDKSHHLNGSAPNNIDCEHCRPISGKSAGADKDDIP